MQKDDIRKEIEKIIIEKLDIKTIDDLFSKSYLEIGINSILFIKLLINIEVAMDIEFEEDIINIGQGYVFEDLVTYIEEQTN